MSALLTCQLHGFPSHVVSCLVKSDFQESQTEARHIDAGYSLSSFGLSIGHTSVP
jgi:hypothetical protein